MVPKKKKKKRKMLKKKIILQNPTLTSREWGFFVAILPHCQYVTSLLKKDKRKRKRIR